MSVQKSKFITIDNKLVNLERVSNIRVVKKSNKIFFNMNYSIQIDNKMISDYIEVNYDELHKLSMTIASLQLNEYIQENFISYYGGLINKNCVSSIKPELDRLKICINLSNPVSFRSPDLSKLNETTSDYIFINCNDIDSFNNELNMIKSAIL